MIKLDIKGYGSMMIELDPVAAPKTVANFEALVEKGFYDALIINLGSGEGDNWWCVVYPPLCFVGEGNYVYRSKIKDVINDFFKKEKE